jgi:hypothetical protein
MNLGETYALEPGFRLYLDRSFVQTSEQIRQAARTDGLLFLITGRRLRLWAKRPAGSAYDRWVAYADRLADELANYSQKGLSRFPIKQSVRNTIVVPEHDAVLRSDQITSSRHWGIQFDGEPTLIDAIERRFFDDVVSILGDCARGAAKVFNRSDRYDPRWLPGLEYDPFEHLIADILNEHKGIAHHASFEEDFIEKTDLRVRYPDLERRHGARVQVTRMLHQDQMIAKTTGVELHDEFVFLSPLTIAEARNTPTPEVEAKLIYGALAHALRTVGLHPVGPRNGVPPGLRAEICDYVRTAAFASTEKLRDRERRTGAKPGWVAAALSRKDRIESEQPPVSEDE